MIEPSNPVCRKDPRSQKTTREEPKKKKGVLNKKIGGPPRSQVQNGPRKKKFKWGEGSAEKNGESDKWGSSWGKQEHSLREKFKARGKLERGGSRRGKKKAGTSLGKKDWGGLPSPSKKKKTTGGKNPERSRGGPVGGGFKGFSLRRELSLKKN